MKAKHEPAWTNGFVRRTVRKLQSEFPGVSSYSTVHKLVMNGGEVSARRQLQEWKDAGTSAPRKG